MPGTLGRYQYLRNPSFRVVYMGRGNPQREGDGSVRQRNSQRRMHLRSNEGAAFAVTLSPTFGSKQLRYRNSSLLSNTHTHIPISHRLLSLPLSHFEKLLWPYASLRKPVRLIYPLDARHQDVSRSDVGVHRDEHKPSRTTSQVVIAVY